MPPARWRVNTLTCAAAALTVSTARAVTLLVNDDGGHNRAMAGITDTDGDVGGTDVLLPGTSV